MIDDTRSYSDDMVSVIISLLIFITVPYVNGYRTAIVPAATDQPDSRDTQ